MQESKFIPSKRKPRKLKTSDQTAETPKLPKDLEDKWNAVQACATAFNCLQNGSFAHSYHAAVNASLAFLMKLHEQTVEDAMTHPDASLIPELKEQLDKKAAGNGQAN